MAESNSRFVDEVRLASRRIFRVKEILINVESGLIGIEKYSPYQLDISFDIFKLQILSRQNVDIHRLRSVEERILKLCTKTLIKLNMIEIESNEIFVHINIQFEALQHLSKRNSARNVQLQ